jgi:hypothetical protein
MRARPSAFSGMRCPERAHDVNVLDAYVGTTIAEPPEVEVVIEVPRDSFHKRGPTGHVDFVSPRFYQGPTALGFSDASATRMRSSTACLICS